MLFFDTDVRIFSSSFDLQVICFFVRSEPCESELYCARFGANSPNFVMLRTREVVIGACLGGCYPRQLLGQRGSARVNETLLTKLERLGSCSLYNVEKMPR